MIKFNPENLQNSVKGVRQNKDNAIRQIEKCFMVKFYTEGYDGTVGIYLNFTCIVSE